MFAKVISQIATLFTSTAIESVFLPARDSPRTNPIILERSFPIAQIPTAEHLSFEARVNISNGSIPHRLSPNSSANVFPIRKHPLLAIRMDDVAKEAGRASEKTSSTTTVSPHLAYSQEPPRNRNPNSFHDASSLDFTGLEIDQRPRLPTTVFYSHLPWPSTQFELERSAVRVTLERTYDPRRTPRYAVIEMEGMLKKGSYIYCATMGYGVVGNIMRNLGYYVGVRVAFPIYRKDKKARLLFRKVNILFPVSNIEMSQERRAAARLWEENHPDFVLELVERWDSR